MENLEEEYVFELLESRSVNPSGDDVIKGTLLEQPRLYAYVLQSLSAFACGLFSNSDHHKCDVNTWVQQAIQEENGDFCFFFS